MVKKRNLKEHLTDDTLDLSLSDLQSVPVKEIAAIPKATCLDLSSNLLTSLGLNFATSLVHLIKLDLCRNQLTELPENFGLLVNLKYLDLYRNKLQTLPLSFCNLKHLRWLDLKENPLVPKMMQIAGPCLDAQGCQFAARNMVKFLSELNREVETEKLRKEAQQKIKLDKELLEQTQKKESKKKKKKKNAAKVVESNKEVTAENGNARTEIIDDNNVDKLSGQVGGRDKIAPSRSVCSYIMSAIKTIFTVLLVLALLFYTVSMFDETTSKKLLKYARVVSGNLAHMKLPKMMWIYAEQMRTLLLSFTINLVALVRYSVLQLIDIYSAIYNNKNVQLYIESFKENLNILYIRVADIVVDNYERFSKYIQGYLK